MCSRVSGRTFERDRDLLCAGQRVNLGSIRGQSEVTVERGRDLPLLSSCPLVLKHAAPASAFAETYPTNTRTQRDRCMCSGVED